MTTMLRKRLSRRILEAAGCVLAATLAVTVAIASSTHTQIAVGTTAEHLTELCPDKEITVCLYDLPDYNLRDPRARHVEYVFGDPDMTDDDGPRFNNMASSWRNETQSDACAYDGVRYTGASTRLPSGTVSPILYSWDNRFSSIKLVPRGSPC